MGVKALILAAGKGTRMKSKNPKVLFDVAGKPMIEYVLNTAEKISSDKSVVVISPNSHQVKEKLEKFNVEFAVQEKQNGTADAVLAAKNLLSDYSGKILILCGDMPLITPETLKSFINKTSNHVSFISVSAKNPSGYGRVVRGADGSVLKIVEEKDANEYEKKITEINTGVYLVQAKELFNRLESINNNNAQKEFYLTDIVKKGCEVFTAKQENEFIGINDRKSLALASKLLWLKRANTFMDNGISIKDPDTFYCDDSVTMDHDVEIHPNVTLKGQTNIKSGTTILSGCKIVDSVVEENCTIKENTVITQSFVGENSQVGPMAHLRPGTVLQKNNKIGNFVEIKKSEIGENSKASHLTYIGDAIIGKNVNIGCGTITCNYDGVRKHKTVIHDNVFVGSDVQFVAPVEIGEGALIAAGSTITKDVPENSLGISRSDQKNKEGWTLKRKKKNSQKE
jgi:bifunctional UDP-N-acetylglucosamine pyrophosphorylase/glucosamine-1-phosphate N-acetyltransferase